MLGEFVDDYTVQVIDVFAMPQSGTTVSVESVDHVFQTKMLEMLKQTGRPESVVGWYHSHPGFGCWLSSVDINTQQSFESLTSRSVAVVVDPIQSVKGKVVIDAFRLINPHTVLAGQEPRQTTSNIGHINKPSIQALIHGLNRHYYSIAVNYRKTELEQAMLMNLHKRNWTEGLRLRDFKGHQENNEKAIKVGRSGAPYLTFWFDELFFCGIRQCCPCRKRTTSRFRKNQHCRRSSSRRGTSVNKTRNVIWRKRWKKRWETRWSRILGRCCSRSCDCNDTFFDLRPPG